MSGSAPSDTSTRRSRARLEHGPRLVALSVSHLDAVLAIERAAYPFPWTRGNFVDSMAAGYHADVLLGSNGDLLDALPGHLLGYCIAMPGAGEMHLLNLAVAPSRQGRGYGLFMLDALIDASRQRGDQQVWLEVRPSNQRARDLYLRYGFNQVGLRKGYYPAHEGKREDALVMSLSLEEMRS